MRSRHFKKYPEVHRLRKRAESLIKASNIKSDARSEVTPMRVNSSNDVAPALTPEALNGHCANTNPPGAKPWNGSLTSLLTYEQLAENLQIPVRTIKRWVNLGKVPHKKMGRHIRFYWPHIEEWLRKEKR